MCSGRQDASEQRSICRAPQTDQRPSRAISLVTFLFEHKKVTLPPKAFSKKHPFSNFLALICHSFYKNEVPVAARAYLSCPGKKGSKEAGWGGFELCAPAHKSHLPKTPPGAHFRLCSVVFRSTFDFHHKSNCSYLKEIETGRFWTVSLDYTSLTD